MPGLSFGIQALECRLSCPSVCGVLVPQPGMEPASPALEGRFLTTGPPGKSPHVYFIYSSFEGHMGCFHLSLLGAVLL